MTIRIEMTNPAEHQPSELRALAVFLNNLAEDRESGRIKGSPPFLSISGSVSEIEKGIFVADAGLTRPLADAKADWVERTEVTPAPAPLPPTPETGPAAPSASAPMTPPPAPAADVPPAPPTLSGVELDSAGLPWDGRIHAESKGKIGDGTWRKKRGVDAALVTEVEARLRELIALPAAPAAEVPPAPSAPITITHSGEVETVDSPLIAPPAPVTMPPAVEVPPAPVAPTVTIADVFKFASSAETKGTLSGEARAAALLSLGFNSMIELSARPDMAAEVIEAFKKYGAE